MGTPGGEPKVLLNALKPMLGVVGDIKTSQEVLRVIGMMKDAEKLMSRCVYLNILKATCRQAKTNEEKRATLERFLTTGGWGILNKWLMEFTRSQNYPVLLELIDVLKIMPITVELLKQGNTGKLMKQMTKLENVDVKKSAGQLIKQWKEMIRGGNNEAQDSNKRPREDGKSSTEKPEKRAKLSSDKGISDSSGFMNALNASTPEKPSKKKKRSNSKDQKTTLPLDEILNKPSDDEKLKLEADSDKIAETPASPETTSEESLAHLLVSPAVEAANQALKDADNTVLVDEGSLARKKNKKKRSITWAADDKLVQIEYFELLPGERKAVHTENFSIARQQELLLEKQAFKNRRSEDDKMSEMVQWNRLIPVDNAGVPNFIPGEKSREKYLQSEREKNVLAFIFLTRESLPNSPAEPDFDPEEHSTRTQPRVIPHDEDGTVFPSKATASTPLPSTTNIPDEERIPSPTTKTPPSTTPPQGRNTGGNNNYQDDMSPAVQSIMQNLLKNGPNNNSNGNGGNNQKQSFGNGTEGIPSILDSNIPNPRGGGRGGQGPRFRGASRGGSGGGGRGGNFNNNGNQRQRWEGSNQNMPPQDDWNNYDDGNYNGNNYDNSYDNYDQQSNYRGQGGGKNRNRGSGHFRNNDNYNGGDNYGRGGGRGYFRGGNRGGNGGGNGRGGNWQNNQNGGPPRGGGGNRGKQICQHFQSARGCRNGDRCNFLHVRR